MQLKNGVRYNLVPIHKGGVPHELYFEGHKITTRQMDIIIDYLKQWNNNVRELKYHFHTILRDSIYVLEVNGYPQYMVDIKSIKIISGENDTEILG